MRTTLDTDNGYRGPYAGNTVNIHACLYEHYSYPVNCLLLPMDNILFYSISSTPFTIMLNRTVYSLLDNSSALN